MRRTCTSIRSSSCTTWHSLPYPSVSSEVRPTLPPSYSFALTLFSLAFDQDVHAKAALAFPQLYVRGIRGLEYTKTKFWMYMLDGLYQSAVAFFIPYMAWTFAHPVSWNGIPMESIADFGTTASVAAIFAANCFVGLNTH